MFFRLHGGNGTGKSYPVYRLLEDFEKMPFMWPAQLRPNDNKTKEKLVGYVLPGNLFVCGKYDGSQTGGGDALGNFTYHFPWLGDYVTQTFPHVVYESMMGTLSNPFTYWAALEDRMREEGHACQGMIHLLMDTPWPVVEERIRARRSNSAFAGTENKMNKMLANWNSGRRYFARIEEAGRLTDKLKPETSYEQFREILRKGGWEY